jgi:anaerobic ribonucleoside-triphosphate reductase activating protein
LDCPACITPQLQAANAGHKVSLPVVLKRLLDIPMQLDGITITGGEPFEQAATVAVLLESLRQQRPTWNVLLFSGYPLHYLQQQGEHASALLAQLDLLIDGPYKADAPSSHPLLASNNQQLHALSPCGQALLAACAALPHGAVNAGLGEQSDWLIGIADPEQRAQAHRYITPKHKESSRG